MAWKNGAKSGRRGKATVAISKHIKRYLLQKYHNRCNTCNWSKKHPATGSIPLEINHKDGNAKNNVESNLELLCPNCHALTSNVRNLNQGRGHKQR